MHTLGRLPGASSRPTGSRDGIIGPVTRSVLHAPTAKRCDKRPIPVNSGTGRPIVVSQTHNWVWLVGSDGKAVAQGGIIDNPVVLSKGTYYQRRLVRRRGAHLAPRGPRAARSWTTSPASPRAASASTASHARRYPQIHANWLLGTEQAQSHGCIRLSLTMSHLVWNFTASATKVLVI